MNNMPGGRFGLYISILGRAAGSYFHRELEPLGLGPGQQAYLLVLIPGESVPQDKIARRLMVDKANVTRAVKGLEKLGYVSRRDDGVDGRVRLVSLTTEGEKAQRKARAVSARWMEIISSGISADAWKRTEEVLRQIAIQANRYSALSGPESPAHDGIGRSSKIN